MRPRALTCGNGAKIADPCMSLMCSIFWPSDWWHCSSAVGGHSLMGGVTPRVLDIFSFFEKKILK